MPRMFAWLTILVVVLALAAVWVWAGRDTRHPPGQQPAPHALNQGG